MSDQLYPSGPWTGFYNYGPKDKRRMDLHLTFSHGKVTGEGTDDVGPFVVKGQYDVKNAECWWMKTYVGGHDVYYRGFREGKGIWGTWEIRNDSRGGFHIWPRRAGEGERVSEATERTEPVDAVATSAKP